MHECYSCGQACDCDSEDTWYDDDPECTCDCQDSDEGDLRVKKRVTIKYQVDPEALVNAGITQNLAFWQSIEIDFEINRNGEIERIRTVNGEIVESVEDLGE